MKRWSQKHGKHGEKVAFLGFSLHWGQNNFCGACFKAAVGLCSCQAPCVGCKSCHFISRKFFDIFRQDFHCNIWWTLQQLLHLLAFICQLCNCKKSLKQVGHTLKWDPRVYLKRHDRTWQPREQIQTSSKISSNCWAKTEWAWLVPVQCIVSNWCSNSPTVLAQCIAGSAAWELVHQMHKCFWANNAIETQGNETCLLHVNLPRMQLFFGSAT